MPRNLTYSTATTTNTITRTESCPERSSPHSSPHGRAHSLLAAVNDHPYRRNHSTAGVANHLLVDLNVCTVTLSPLLRKNETQRRSASAAEI